jgi:hypothetical protein
MLEEMYSSRDEHISRAEKKFDIEVGFPQEIVSSTPVEY